MTRISDRLDIRFDTNEILTMKENEISQRTKVEPRIMHVLQILMKHSPEVVSREKLIQDVWDNYGGADDALNQSISHLRKLLNDTNKQDRIIETVVKKGYRFTIQGEAVLHATKEKVRVSRTSKWLFLVLIILITLVILLVLNMTSEAPLAPEI